MIKVIDLLSQENVKSKPYLTRNTLRQKTLHVGASPSTPTIFLSWICAVHSSLTSTSTELHCTNSRSLGVMSAHHLILVIFLFYPREKMLHLGVEQNGGRPLNSQVKFSIKVTLSYL